MRVAIMPIASLVLAVLGSSADGQIQSPFAGRLLPVQGQIAGGNLVDVTKGIFADVDADGDADVLGVSYGQAAFVVVLASGGVLASPGVAHQAGISAVAVAASDVDQDGDLDALVLCLGSNPTPPQLWTYFNDGSGGFAAPPLVRALSTPFNWLQVIRLNNDAIPDLVLNDGTGYLRFLTGTGGGNYGPEVFHPTQIPASVVFVDDDGDGDDDMHFASGGTLVTRRNNGGVFAGPVVDAPLLSSMHGLAYGDMNGDGFLDAVVWGSSPAAPPSSYQSMAQVVFGSAAGTYAAGPVQVLINAGVSYGPTLRDLDGDGDLDLIAFDPQGAYPEDLVLYARNDGAGTFSSVETIDFQANMSWSSVDAGDVTADGFGDLGVFLNARLVLYPSLGANGLVRPKNVGIGGSGGNLFRVADLDRDGRPDVISVIGSAGSTALSIVLDVDGPATVTQIIPIGAALQDLALGDWNRDGILDLLVAAGPTVQGLGLFLGNGTGGFGSPALIPYSGNPVFAKDADVNGDGNLDVVILSNQLSVLPGTGTGAFGAPITTTVCPAATCSANDGLALGDLNDDGLIDAIVSHPMSASNVASTGIYLGAGNGTFSLFTGNPNPISGAPGAVLADWNGDGIEDVIYVTGGGLVLAVQSGLGNGGFGPAGSASLQGPGGTSIFSGDLAVGDVSGDGVPDAVMAGGAVVLNDGSGGFATPMFHVSPFWTKVALADVDQDLQTDALFFQPSRGRVSISRNLRPCTGTAYELGLGCPGAGGIVPRLTAFGLPQPGGGATLRVDRALGGSPAALLFGPNPANLPFGFGCNLFVDPAAIFSLPIALVGLPGPGRGHVDLGFSIAPGSAPFQAAAQVIVFDPASPVSYAGSNGMFFIVQ